MGTSILHIKSETDCIIYLFGELKGIAKSGVFFNLEIREGEQDLMFVSMEDDSMRCNIQFMIDEMDSDYELMVSKSQFERHHSGLRDIPILKVQRDTDARFQIEGHYVNWDGVGEDSVRAVEWYTKAAEQGETRAQFNLGCCYYCGIGVEKNLDKAIELFTRAAEQDYVTAQFTLGVCYENGCGVEKDMVKAVEWYTKAAERGFASAQFKLGRYYCEIAKDKNNAFFYFKQSADQGNEEAIVCLACCYECGAGTNKDCSLAFKLVREVAEKGYRRGQRVLGIYFIDGIGVDRDAFKAVEWYKKAAEQGDVAAQYNLGCCYENGDGVEKDFFKAVEWFTKAAEQGEAIAQRALGNCYNDGKGVEKNFVKAVEWYKKAAEQGDEIAQFNLGLSYYNGYGVEKDMVKAVEWFTRAAEQGEAMAQRALGICYDQGNGVKQDLEEAVRWFHKAAANKEKNKLVDAELKDVFDKIKRDKNGSALVRLCASMGFELVPYSSNRIIHNAVKRLADMNISSWEDYKEHIINSGKGCISDELQADCYLAAYGFSHKKKLNCLYDTYLKYIGFGSQEFEVIDYGCGQGLATIGLIEHISTKNIHNLRRITLIDKSECALSNAEKYVSNVYECRRYMNSMKEECEINVFCASLPAVGEDFVHPSIHYPVIIHLLSNIIDITSISLEQLAESIINSGRGRHYVLATHSGTNNVDPMGNRMKHFFKLLPNGEINDTNQGVTDAGVFWSHLIGFSHFETHPERNSDLPF